MEHLGRPRSQVINITLRFGYSSLFLAWEPGVEQQKLFPHSRKWSKLHQLQVLQDKDVLPRSPFASGYCSPYHLSAQCVPSHTRGYRQWMFPFSLELWEDRKNERKEIWSQAGFWLVVGCGSLWYAPRFQINHINCLINLTASSGWQQADEIKT